MKLVKKGDCNYLMMVGVSAMFGSLLCAWLRAVLGGVASGISLIFFSIAIYSFLKVYTTLYEAYKHNTRKAEHSYRVRSRNRKDAVAFANNFARQLEAEGEREFWLSNKA